VNSRPTLCLILEGAYPFIAGGVSSWVAEYPYPVDFRFSFFSEFRRYWQFAVIGLFYNAAIWVDKWIMWFAPGRAVVTGGIWTNPAYDSAMFLAYLTIVPATTLFLVAVETRFFEHYFASIRTSRTTRL
jgi:polysaccharide biosynthesis protein PelG